MPVSQALQVHSYLDTDKDDRATVLMSNLLKTPEDFYNQIKRYTASVVASITYGQRGPTPDSFWARVCTASIIGWTKLTFLLRGRLRCYG
jgi:hypothetical protein